jgi:hypothetical protein
MKIKYKKSRLYTNLIFGLVWMTLGVFVIIEKEKFRWYDMIYIVFGLIYSAQSAYEYYYQHLTLTNEFLNQHTLFQNKQIRLADIIKIKSIGGDYIVKTESDNIYINSNLLDKDSLERLIQKLKTLKIEWI